jgi:hypothetical protein
MAEAAGFPARRAFSDLSDLYPRLERFAALVAAAEREACAKVCEPQETHDDPLTAWKIAAAIRERGEI